MEINVETKEERKSKLDRVVKYTKLEKHILLQKSEPVTEFNDELKDLVDRLAASLYFYEAMGISAIQIGIPKRVFLIKASKDSFAAFVNPEIVALGEEFDTQMEGCLSFPEVFVPVRRPTSVNVKFFDVHGEEQSLILEGIQARCYIHEYEHTLGVTFLKHVSKLKQDLIFSKMRKIERTGKIKRDELTIQYIEAMAAASANTKNEEETEKV